MKSENLAIISNEKTHQKNNKFFCDNIDLKSIPEGLDKNFQIELFLRKSKIERVSHEIQLKKIFVSKGIFPFLYKILRRSKINEKYLLISLSPYTFCASLLLFILRKKIYLYIRSDGYEEYRCYSKLFGPLIYHVMLSITSKISNMIACRSHLLRGKRGNVVSPSQLNKKWFINRKPANLQKIKILYVGRIKIEKGVFSLLKLVEKINEDIKIKIVNSEKNYDSNLKIKNFEIVHFKNVNDSIISVYDNHNIFILPSFTEAHPQVLDESLARLRPVIIFPEISHVKRNRKGIFEAERNHTSLKRVIKFIMKNYSKIQNTMRKNNLPTKESFLKEITEILKK